MAETTTSVPIKLKPKEKKDYVSNKQLYESYVNWYKDTADCQSEGMGEPQIPRFISESIMKICNRLSYRPNFINYSFRDEMVADAIENCVRTVKNFNPARSDNPFSFLTTIANNAFLRRIERERKQSYVKGKMISEISFDEFMVIDEQDENTLHLHNQFIDYLRDNNYIQSSTEPKRPRKSSKAVDNNLSLFMGIVADE